MVRKRKHEYVTQGDSLHFSFAIYVNTVSDSL